MSKLKGRVALVTGASKGIGAGIAKELALAGASVVVNYATDRAGAGAVVQEITGGGGSAVAIQGDVSNADDVSRLFAEVNKAFAALDILVNNAGVYKSMPLEEMTEAEFHREFGTNVLGPLLVIRESLKYFGPTNGRTTLRRRTLRSATTPSAICATCCAAGSPRACRKAGA